MGFGRRRESWSDLVGSCKIMKGIGRDWRELFLCGPNR